MPWEITVLFFTACALIGMALLLWAFAMFADAARTIRQARQGFDE